MKRYIQKVFAALMCACLVSTCAPIPVLADEGGGTAVGPMRGFSEGGQAVTSVNVLAVAGDDLSITPDFAASIDEIAGNAGCDLIVHAKDASSYTYQWYRAEFDLEGNVGEAVELAGETSASYLLSQHTETLTDETDYLFTVKIVDAQGRVVELSVRVSVSDGYRDRTLPDGAALPRVHGLSIHRDATLATSPVDESSASYGFLQQAAQGMKIDAAAWQLDLTGAPAGKRAFVGSLTVSLSLSAEAAAAYASGDEVKVVGIGADGAAVLHEAVVDGDSSVVTFTTETLGVFAVAFAVPAEKTYAITATAGEGGSISPAGRTLYAEGASATYTVLPDVGYLVKDVTVDGAAVELAGNSYTFEDVRAPHDMHVTFEEAAPPVDPDLAYTVTAKVDGGNGLVGLDAVEPSDTVQLSVLANESATVRFVPDEGYALASVTVQTGDRAPEPVNVFGLSFFIATVTADTVVTVTYQKGIAPPIPVHVVTATSATAGGSVSPATQTVPHAGSATVTMVPKDGFEFESVLVDGKDRTSDVTASGALVLHNVMSDLQVQATFVASRVDPPIPTDPTLATVHASASAGGAISPAGDVLVPKGAAQTFYFLPDGGKRVGSLTVDGARFEFHGSSYTLFGIAAETSIAVEFEDDDPEHPAPVPDVYTVQASAGAHGAVSPAGETTVVKGGALLFAFRCETGYEVDVVKANGAVVQRGGTSYRLTDVTADTTIEVTFKQTKAPEPEPPLVEVDVKVAVSAEGDTGGSVSPSGSLSVARGSSQTFHVFPEQGYDLDKVLVNDEPTAFQPVQSPSLRSARAADGTAGGYRFSVENVTDATRINVHFKKLKPDDPVPPPVTAYEVSASATTGGMISPSDTTWVARGGSVSFTVKADEGWHLASLTAGDQDVTDQVSRAVYELSNVTADTDVRAVFKADAVDPEPAPYVTVHATSSKGGSVSPGGDVRVATGESQTFAFLPNDGYVLDEVTVDGQPVVPLDGTYTLFDLTADRSIHASFREKQAGDPEPVVPMTHEVRTEASEGGSILPAGLTKVVKGSSLLITLAADAGYELDRVLLDGTEDVTGQVEEMTLRLNNVVRDCRVDALFKKIGGEEPMKRHTVTAESSEGGSIDPAGTFEVDDGSSVTFTLTAEEGYELASLVAGGIDVTDFVKNGSYELSDVRHDVSVYAMFKEPAEPEKPVEGPYSIEAAVSGGHGEVSPRGTVMVAAGSEQAFYFYPDEGYTVDDVVVDGEPLSWAPRSYVFENVRANHALSVSFKPVAASAEGVELPGGALVHRILTQTGDHAGRVLSGLAVLMVGAAAMSIAAWRRMRSRANEERIRRR